MPFSREHRSGEQAQLLLCASWASDHRESVESLLLGPMEHSCSMVVEQQVKILKICLVFQGVNEDLCHPKESPVSSNTDSPVTLSPPLLSGGEGVCE